MKQDIIKYEASIMFVAIGFWLLAIGCWPRAPAVGRESPLRGLPPLGAAAMDGGVQLLQDVA